MHTARKTALLFAAMLGLCLAPVGAVASPLATPAALVFVAEGMPVAAMTAGEVLIDERAKVLRLDARRAQVIGDREALEGKLDALSREIVELKSRRIRGPRAEAELNRKLQGSRDLSSRIDSLTIEQEEITADLIRATSSLADSYDALVDSARLELEKLASSEDGEERGREVMNRIAVLEAERRAVLEGLSGLQGSHREFEDEARPLLRARPRTDDPEELRARADMLRDTKDRLTRRLGDLDRKEKTVRRQRALEREMDGFVAQSRLFDEGDRSAARLVARDSDGRPVAGGSLVPSRSSADAAIGDPAAPPEGSDGIEGDLDAGDGETGEYYDGQPVAEPEEPTGVSPSPGSEPVDDFTREDSSLHQLDRVTTRAEASAALDALLVQDIGGTLEDIEEHRREIERLIRRLERRAGSLERRADLLDDEPR